MASAKFSALAKAFFFLNTVLVVSFAKAGIEPEDAELDKPLYSTPIIDLINNDPDAGWTAGINEQFINFTLRDLRKMGGTILEPHLDTDLVEESPDDLEEQLKQLPTSFDARQNWNCPSMWRILNQGSCGACWAFSAVQVLQDRFCISYGLDLQLSPNNVLTCCGNCGNCTSGYLHLAYEYLASTGTVSAGCSPYFDTTACPRAGCISPACKKNCENGEDMSKRYRSSRPYRLRSVPSIMQEIMTKGPVSAALEAYEDILTYKSGVYRHLQGKFILGHAVKLVGWDVTTQGENYWIVTNQWGANWGENGHFRIRKGVNECGIEKWVYGADAVKPQNHLVSVV